jgi:hypothetical protein
MVRYRDREWLDVMYHGREHSPAELAGCCGVSPRTIRKYLDEHGIPTRDAASERVTRSVRSVETMGRIPISTFTTLFPFVRSTSRTL